MSPASPPSAPHPSVARAARRYAAVTVAAAIVNQACYSTLFSATPWPAVACVAVAAAAVGIPTLLVLARWAWGVSGPSIGLVAGYSASTVVNVLAASAAVWWADRAGAPDGVLVVTPPAVYAVAWIARFAVLDRLLVPSVTPGGHRGPSRPRGGAARRRRRRRR